MKTPSDHLFKLIKTLTKGEKRAFRMKASSGKDAKKYLAIFSVIDGQDIYDEAAIKAKFKHESWVGRFNAAKEYLYKALLEELSVYNQTHDPQYQLSELLIRIRVLQNKGFYTHSGKLIKKAKVLANALNDYLRMLEILNLQSSNHPGGINPQLRDEIRQEQRHIFELLENESLYDSLYKRSFEISLKSGYQGFNANEAKEYDVLMEHKTLSDIENARTFQAKRQHINIHYFHCLGKGKFDEMHQWILAAKQLFESNPILIKQHPVNFATTLLNLNQSHVKRKEFTSGMEAIEQLRTFYPKDKLKRHERLTYIIEYAGLHHEISLLNATGDFANGLKKTVELTTFFEKHKKEASDAVITRHYFLLAQTYFGAKDFKSCQSCLEKIIDNSKNHSRNDIQKQSRLLLVMVYYEQEKYDLLDPSLRSTRRYFNKIGKMTGLEQKIFKLFHFSLDLFVDKDKVKQEMKDIDELLMNTWFVPNYEIVRNWVASKIRQVDYVEVVKGDS
ncbi:MAG: hypothetical protein AB8B56_05500 [Crocinitomicaceae bacterium]